jgi:hypothetical protein
MNDEQLDFVSDLLFRKMQLTTARAFHLKLAVLNFYLEPRTHAESLTSRSGAARVTRSRVPAVVDAARTIRKHWHAVLRWFTSRLPAGYSRESTASFKLPRPRLAATNPLETRSPNRIRGNIESCPLPQLILVHCKFPII